MSNRKKVRGFSRGFIKKSEVSAGSKILLRWLNEVAELVDRSG